MFYVLMERRENHVESNKYWKLRLELEITRLSNIIRNGF